MQANISNSKILAREDVSLSTNAIRTIGEIDVKIEIL